MCVCVCVCVWFFWGGGGGRCFFFNILVFAKMKRLSLDLMKQMSSIRPNTKDVCTRLEILS